MIIEVKNARTLYFILTRFQKTVIYFYANWRKECSDFNKIFAQSSRNNSYSSIAFCQVNVDTLSDIQELYDINNYKTPGLIFIRNGLIYEKLYGNKPEIFRDKLFDFGKL